MSPLITSLLTLALTSLVLWVIRPYRFRHIGWIAALPPAAVSAWLFTQLPSVSDGSYISVYLSWATQLSLDFALRLDGLALFFALIVTVIGTAIALYTGYYFEHETRLGYFYGLLFLFMTRQYRSGLYTHWPIAIDPCRSSISNDWMHQSTAATWRSR